MNDRQRERLIANCVVLMGNAKTREERLYWASEQAKLIRERSPEQVARMEAAKGLQ